MKNLIKLIFTLVVCSVFFSCASLQEDKTVSSEFSFEKDSQYGFYIEEFRHQDSALLQGQVVNKKEIDKIISELDKAVSENVEPSLSAKIQALNGLFCLLVNNSKKATELFFNAQSLQAGEDQVLLLKSRLEKTNEASLKLIEEYLLFDSENPAYNLEKGILLFKEKKYADCIASFDKAFLKYDQNGQDYIRAYYDGVRYYAWTLYSAGIEDPVLVSALPSNEPLSFSRMIVLTKENTSLLNDFIGDSKITVSSLVKRLESEGMFKALGEEDGENTSVTLTSSKEISRILCARFLWNLYIHASGNEKMQNAYSKRFSRLKNPVSPLNDVPLSSIDFDACLGTVEKEIMNLSDGKNFDGEKTVTELEFYEFVKLCQEKAR